MPDDAPDATLTFPGPLAAWQPRWDAFRRRHPDFAPVDASAYTLPGFAVERFARAAGRLRPILSAAQAAAERDFGTLCDAFHAVGVGHGRPVMYRLLRSFQPLPTAAPAGWGPGARRRLAAAGEELREADERLKGYAGWLLTEPVYLNEAARLARRWGALPVWERPSFPLRRPAPRPPDLPAAEPAGPAGGNFAGAVGDFLDRWGLRLLAAWDLPEPQGPAFPSLLPPGAHALPRHAVHLVIPAHYPLQGDDDLQRLVYEQQRLAADERGVDGSMAGLQHHRAYGQMLEVIHLEAAARSRLPLGPPPAGFVGAVEEAAVDLLGVGRDYVRKLRRAVARCRAGRRASVAWLRPRVR